MTWRIQRTWAATSSSLFGEDRIREKDRYCRTASGESQFGYIPTYDLPSWIHLQGYNTSLPDAAIGNNSLAFAYTRLNERLYTKYSVWLPLRHLTYASVRYVVVNDDARNNYNTNTAASFERVVQALLLHKLDRCSFLGGKTDSPQSTKRQSPAPLFLFLSQSAINKEIHNKSPSITHFPLLVCLAARPPIKSKHPSRSLF